MREELVTFETAKLAKEKGFNIECGKYWVETLEHELDLPRSGIEIFPPHAPRVLEYKPVEEYDIVHASAPTQSLLQRWLREEHKLHIFINYTLLSFQFSLVKLDPQGIMDYSLSGKAYMCGEKKTYEEALEWALQEALKLIP